MTFQSFAQFSDARFCTGDTGYVLVGSRQCPRCHTHVFIVADEQGSLLVSYPPQTIDFDASGLPNEVMEALQEAVTCHAQQCYVAAAMMVRKTLGACEA